MQGGWGSMGRKKWFRDRRDQLFEPMQSLPIHNKAVEVPRMFTQCDLELECDEARLKYQWDENARGQYAEEEHLKLSFERGFKIGFERGFKTGFERGFKIGDPIGRIQLCERVLKRKVTSQEMLRAIAVEQLQEFAERLEIQLAERRALEPDVD
jgi:flagellar biosynthesis/type III secretory pathway protein FliH